MSAVFSCDLHMHTFYSDGRAAPEEVLRHAASIGLKTIAITDHDNTNGAREALPLAAQLGLELIPAIEFTSRWDGYHWVDGGDDIDVLGYFLDLDAPALQATERATLNDMYARIAEGCQALSAAGYPVTLDDALAQNPRYAGAVQVIEALRHKGYAENWDAAVALFTANWPQIRPSSFSIEQIIAAIHAAGGVAVLAHPSGISAGNGLLQAEQLKPLVEMGLDGLEIYHPRLDDEARAHFLVLAQRFGLLVTGGTDEHGWPAGFPSMGTEPVTPEIIEALRTRSRQHQRSRQ
jgi:predicted metal-dependent phosphoesterase TrpH